MLKANKKTDSMESLLLDFLLKLNFFLKIYLSDFLFKFGMFKSAIHQCSKNKLIILTLLNAPNLTFLGIFLEKPAFLILTFDDSFN